MEGHAYNAHMSEHTMTTEKMPQRSIYAVGQEILASGKDPLTTGEVGMVLGYTLQAVNRWCKLVGKGEESPLHNDECWRAGVHWRIKRSAVLRLLGHSAPPEPMPQPLVAEPMVSYQMTLPEPEPLRAQG